MGISSANVTTHIASIDLNADLGESFGNWTLGDDAAMLAVVSSANVACGFHAGDPDTIRRTCRQAVARGVRIGAQVGYPDLPGFGRRFIDMAPSDLTSAVIYQTGALTALAASVGGTVDYVKPHGALYNTIVSHEGQAAAVVAALTALGGRLPLMGLPTALATDLARRAGLPVITEAFADRAYLPDGSLAPRSMSGAVLHDSAAIAERAVRMVTDHSVVAVDGSVLEIVPESLCLHGDTPGAVAHADAVRAALVGAGVAISSRRG